MKSRMEKCEKIDNYDRSHMNLIGGAKFYVKMS